MNSLTVSLLVAGTVGAAMPGLLRPMLKRMGVIDIPNSRSSHVVPVIRGAGLGPLSAVVAGLGLLLVSSWDDLNVSAYTVLIVLVTGACAAGLGWVEDFRGLPVKVRAGSQLVIGGLGTLALAFALSVPWWWLFVGAIVVAAYINVANFMDGIDGISGAHGCIVGVAFALIGADKGLGWVSAVGLVMAVSFAAFLPWNLVRGRMFLGDVGSYLLGGLAGVLSIAAVMAGVPVVAALGPLAIYLADAGVTLLRRILRREKWYEAHRSHVYQRLTDTGLTHVQVTGIVSAFSCLSAGFGLFALSPYSWAAPLAALGIIVVLVAYLGMPVVLNGKSPARDDVPGTVAARGARERGHGVDGRVSSEPTPTPGPRDARWAVVGASGFIGNGLSSYLRTKGIDVVEVRAPRLRLPTASAAHGFDVDRAAAIQLSAELKGCSVVINAAGMASPDGTRSPSLFGANALLPLVIAHASATAGTRRYIHLSSAAVQGRRLILDESADAAPFSPYSESKALGERALSEFQSGDMLGHRDLDVVIVRATSVQGVGRRTTEQLRRLARSPIASVATPGDHPSIVSSLDGLVDFVYQVGVQRDALPLIVLQPWEGLSTRDVLLTAGGKEPVQIPAVLCRAVLRSSYFIGRWSPSLLGHVRRMEVMWFGQRQDAKWSLENGIGVRSGVTAVLRRDE